MDLTNLDTWRDGLQAVEVAPHIVLLVVVAVAVGVWWLRGLLARSERNGLRAQNDALKSSKDALETHLRFAVVHTGNFSVTLAKAKSEAETLRTQIQTGEPQPNLLTSANSTISSIDFALGASNELQQLVATPTGAPKMTSDDVWKQLSRPYPSQP